MNSPTPTKAQGMALTDWLAVASAVAAAVGLGFTADQLRLARRDAKAMDALAIEGVAVSWHALEAPDHAGCDGIAEWLYEISVHNPGRFPIDNVRVVLHVPVPVQRVRYSGRLGEETIGLTMRHPVLIGGESREWQRRLRMPYASADRLRETYAEVSFRDTHGKDQHLRWPR
jgi:hypothetical protein